MICPSCGHTEIRVLETRDSAQDIRRRRECKKCYHRWTTFESIPKTNSTLLPLLYLIINNHIPPNLIHEYLDDISLHGFEFVDTNIEAIAAKILSRLCD